MLVNQNTFNLKSTITDDWGSRHRVAIDLEALSSAQDWQMQISLPSDYKIKEIYGAEIIQKDGKNYISGKSGNESLTQGAKTQIVLIVDEGNSKNSPLIKPKFIFADSISPAPVSPKLDTNSSIVEDWAGGYKLEVDITAKSSAKNWSLKFNLPYQINAAYGVDLVNNGNGSYTISGQNNQVNLNKGQSIKPVFIVSDNGKQPLTPEFTLGTEPVVEQPPTSKLSASPAIIEDWAGGYKVELNITAESKANGWTLDFNLPYEISAAYGANLVKNSNGSYTISGQNDQVNLNKGQSIKPILVINDQGKQAIAPDFGGSGVTPQPESPPPTTIPDGNGQPVGQQGKFAYGEALQKNFLFFEANRSGDLGADNRLEWRKDSTLNDGSRVGRDLEGGYFDAGDHVKFGQPMAASVNMLAWGGVEYTDAYKQSGQFDELLKAVKWGTDYFLKAHETGSNGKTSKLWVQVGEGGSANDHGYWGSPESVEQRTTRNAFYIDASRPGSDVAASTSSAFAAASMLFRGVDNQYADELLKNAKQLYEFAETYQGKYSDSVPQASPFYTSWSGYGDELASGAAWLHKATGEQSYLTKAENYFKSKVGGLGDWSWAVDDHSYGAAVILAQESNDPFFKGQVEGWLNKWINGGGNIKYTSGGFAHRAAWGSVPVTASAAYLAQLYNDTVKQDSRYTNFANNQVDYILGDNPANMSYMVGFGNKSPQRPHHRGSSPNVGGSATAPQENILYGAIVGGPGSANDFSHNDSRHDWVTNEVGTSYNAPVASALIQQYDNLGGDPLTNAELDQLIGVDANGVGF
jgi:endoglucanase